MQNLLKFWNLQLNLPKSAVLSTRHIFVDASPRYAVLSTRHRGFFFSNFSPTSSPFRITRHKFPALKTCFYADRRSGALTLLATNLTLPPCGHLLPILLADKLSPLCPAVILHPCWRPTSTVLCQQSSSTHPASSQTLPSPRRREKGDGRRDIGCGVWVVVVVAMGRILTGG